MSTFWARMGGVTVSAEMILLEAKLGPGRPLIESIARRKVAAAIAWDQGVSVSERDVEESLSRFYADQGLKSLDEIRAWRARHHLKEENIRSFLRERQLIERLRLHLVPDSAVEERFRARSADYRQAEVEFYSFGTERAAQDFITAVQTGEIEPRMGERQRLSRELMPADLAEEFVNAGEGGLLGPMRLHVRNYAVVRLVRWEQPQLTAALGEEIREALFREALAPAMSGDPLTFLV